MLLVPLWLVPLGFAAAGHWPFGLLIALGATAWVVLAGRDRRR